MFWNLLLCIWFWAENVISKQSFWLLWARGLYVPVCPRWESSCMSKMLLCQKITPVCDFCSTQGCTGSLWEAQGLCLTCIKILRTYAVDLCFIPWCVPSKHIWINGSTVWILRICSSFYSLYCPHLYRRFLLLAFSVPQCCLHSLSAVLTDRSTVSENAAMVKSGVKRDDKILDLLQKKSDWLQSDWNFYPEAAWHEAAFSCLIAAEQGEGSQFFHLLKAECQWTLVEVLCRATDPYR